MDTQEIVKTAFDDFTNGKIMDATDKIRYVVQAKVNDKLVNDLGLEKPTETEIIDKEEE